MLLNNKPIERDVLSSINLISLYQNEIDEFTGPDKAGLCRGICPFCYDDRRTLYVIAESGNFNCFGCGTKGSFLNFMANKYEIDRDEIIPILEAVQKTESAVDVDDIQAEPDLQYSDLTISSCDNDNGKQKGGFHMPPELYLSPAFLSLKKNSIKLHIALKDLKTASETDEIEASYSYFVQRFKINRGSLPGAFDELMGKGFVRLIHHGGTQKHDTNRYRLRDDFLDWQPGMKPFAVRPMRMKTECEIKPKDEDEKATTPQFSGKTAERRFRTIRKSLSSFFKRSNDFNHGREANTTAGTV